MAFRSLLFTPANRMDRVAKGLVAGPDWLVLDLEDGVPESEKDDSRVKVEKHFSTGNIERQKIAVRINLLSTGHGIKDIHAMLNWKTWPEMIILPKVESSIQIQQIRELSSKADKEPYILATMETAMGIEYASQILDCQDPKLVAAYGSADHTAQTGGSMGADSLSWARGRMVNAAAVAGIPVLDGVWLKYDDLDGLRKEAELAKSMGFSGKIAIHPKQIDTINEMFTPTEREVREAIQMLKVAENAGHGAFSFNGRMVDPPVLVRARQIAGFNEEGK